MCNIEGELSRLTTLLKTGVHRRPLIGSLPNEDSSATLSIEDHFAEATASLLPTHEHGLCSQSDHIDRYHGPCALLGLCNAFSDTILSKQWAPSSPPGKDESPKTKKQKDFAKDEFVKDVLVRMCLEAGIEETLNLQPNHTSIRLPPKQFLFMIQNQCFQQADYATDIFVQSSFWSNVERVYSKPSTSADTGLAICFNTLILLILGSEVQTQGNDPLVESHFTLPFLSAIRTALNNPHVLMAPKLANVQALALLVSAPDNYSKCMLCHYDY